MRQQPFLLNILLAVVLGAALAAALIVKTIAPWYPLPAPDIPLAAGLSLAALLLEYYLSPRVERRWLPLTTLGGATFGLLPFAAGYVSPESALQAGLAGGLVFAVLTWMFTAASDRLATDGAGRAAAAAVAVGLFLGFQGFAG